MLKLITGQIDINCDELFSLNRMNSRGHALTFRQQNCTKYSFIIQVTPIWNTLIPATKAEST